MRWSPAKIDALLMRGAWFAGLPLQLRQLLVSVGQVRQYHRGEIVLAAGRPMGLYVPLQGAVALSKVGAVGNEIIYHIAGPGFWFGAVGVLMTQPLELMAAAVGEVTLLSLPRAEALRVIESDPSYRDAVARLAHERFIRVLEALEQTSRPNAVGRVAAKLLTIRELNLCGDAASANMPLAVSQSALALMTSMSRQSVSAALGVLAHAGSIVVGFKQISIVDVARLETIANSPEHALQAEGRKKSSSR